MPECFTEGSMRILLHRLFRGGAAQSPADHEILTLPGLPSYANIHIAQQGRETLMTRRRVDASNASCLFHQLTTYLAMASEEAMLTAE